MKNITDSMPVKEYFELLEGKITEFEVLTLVNEINEDPWITLKAEALKTAGAYNVISLQTNHKTETFRVTQTNPQWISEEFVKIYDAAECYLIIKAGGC